MWRFFRRAINKENTENYHLQAYGPGSRIPKEKNMKRYLLTISYVGSAFCGWQVQPNGYTVQQAMCEAMRKIFGKDIAVTGCSRTDSGVHAREFCCHVDLDTNIPDKKIVSAVNNNTPKELAVIGMREVSPDFHARYSCKGKNYIYKIINSFVMNPFMLSRAILIKQPLNIENMNKAAKYIEGKHDFSAFCAAGSSVSDKVRTVSECSVKKENDTVTVSVTADGFLYNMVRIITGTLIEVGSGRIPPERVKDIIDSKCRDNAGYTVPAEGLYLNKVYY